jgi:CheY-like chemotaxis protein
MGTGFILMRCFPVGEVARRQHPDLIELDLMMPEINDLWVRDFLKRVCLVILVVLI